MTTKLNVGEWLQQARQQLAGISDLPSLEAEVLLAQLSGKPRAWLLAHPEYLISPIVQQYLNLAMESLRSGVPLPYLTGAQEFYGLPFRVDPQVLIPRPETELLVEQAIEWLQACPHRRFGVDVGSGSGCIAITLVKKVMGLRMVAVELSKPALRALNNNLAMHRVYRKVWPVQTDLLAPFASQVFDLVCANLPYIPSKKLKELPVARHEPLLALDGGPDGLNAIRRLLEQAPKLVLPGGLLLLEIESSQAAAALQIARQRFPAADCVILPDLAGQPRLLRIQLGE